MSGSQVVIEEVKSENKNDDYKIYIDKIFQLLSSMIGFLLTFSIWNYGKLNNVLVSCTNCLIASLLLPKHEDIFYSASLGGLSSNTVLVNYGFVILSAIFVFIVFNLLKNVCIGLGGKLGTIAFISNNSTTLIIYLISLSDVYQYSYPFFNKNSYNNIDTYVLIFAPIFSSVSCLLSYIVYEYILVIKNKCMATSLSGSCICLMLYILKTPLRYDDIPNNYGELYMIYVHIGILCGLIRNEVLTEFNYLGNYYFHHYIILSYISGWIGIGLSGILTMGGRHGFTAFLGCNFYIRFLQIIYWFKKILSDNNNNKISNKDQGIIEIYTNRETEAKGMNTENQIKSNEYAIINKQENKA